MPTTAWQRASSASPWAGTSRAWTSKATCSPGSRSLAAPPSQAAEGGFDGSTGSAISRSSTRDETPRNRRDTGGRTRATCPHTRPSARPPHARGVLMAFRLDGVVRRFVSIAKSSPWLMIAIGLHLIVATLLSVVFLHTQRAQRTEAELAIAVSARAAEEEKVPLPEPEPERQGIPELSAELVSLEDVQTFVPTEELPEDVDWHDPIGDPTGTEEENSSTGGTSIGVGIGGHYGTGEPSGILSKRVGSSTGRMKGRPPVGHGQVDTEESVLEGLRWLMRHQNADGSWSARGLHEHCTDPACIPADEALDATFDVGLTALSLLAFLGQGIAPGSKVEIVDEAMGRPPRPAGEVVKRGIRWLMDRQKPDGSFSDSAPFALPENDTLPTMALCEAYGLAPRLREVKRKAQQALDFLVAAQKRAADGSPWGWGIGSQVDLDARHASGALDEAAYSEACQQVDLSVTCWVVMALKSAQSCGFTVPEAALAGALAYGQEATLSGAGGNAGVVVDPADRFDAHAGRREALGMLIRAFAGGAIDDPFLESAARTLAADVPRVSKDRLSVDFYYWYFGTLALNQYDGPDSPRASRSKGEFWEPWNEGLVD